MANDDYEQARVADIEDVGGVLELIEPLEQEGILLKRSRELLETEISSSACWSGTGASSPARRFTPFWRTACGEIACIVSHPDYRGGQRGQRLLLALEQEARRQGLDRVFVLTTQTAHWFIEQGFIESYPRSTAHGKQSLYNLQRNSKVFFKRL